MNKIIPIKSIDRSCDGCTACCEGWLQGNAYGYEFWPGRKCHFLGEKSCTIYEDRPYAPCQKFKCEWLINHDIPEWMKPNLSKVILRSLTVNGFTYLKANEAGEKMDASVLSWLFSYLVDGKIKNLTYQIDKGWNFIGNKDFVEWSLSNNKR